ncbi:TonB-dependent receptor [Methylobacillus gramineus]|uniref:TonB-dependent receptor n=1 Tax=Methylobacillus gramineus TaxID=755169 RepID=UPI001D0011B6|nr:TonB-dependent receptor [Methylobacillus gramineus]MCB5184783.1 TonB-dependent receptor [Methylobacillus gramineus]
MKYIAFSSGMVLLFATYNIAHAEDTPASPSKAKTIEEPRLLDITTVTARRRLEKEQDVPATVSVIRGEELESTRTYQIQDLPQLLPGLTAQFLQPRQSSIAIRGIGNNPANEGLEGSAGIYLDNVYLGRPGLAVFDLLDIAQVDLLRGPQGTLFGKNTTAGVLNITSRKPVFRSENAVEASFGSRDYEQYKVMINQPLNDQAAVRISAYKTHDDGWVKNTYNNQNLNEINRTGVRGQLLLQPSESFNLRLIAEHNEEDSSTGTLVPYSYGPWTPNSFSAVGFPPFILPNPGANLPAGRPGSNSTNGLTHANNLGAGNRNYDPKDYKVTVDGRQRTRTSQDALSAEANWDFNGYKLTSITAWRDWNFKPDNDLDRTDLNGVRGGSDVKHTQYSQEVRLASPLGKRIDYVVGAYYYYQDIENHEQYVTGPSAFALTTIYPNNSAFSGLGYAKTNSYALFGQGTWHITEKLDLTAGLRATLEKKEARVVQNRITPIPVFLSPLLDNYDTGIQHQKDESLSALLTGSYWFNDRILGYASLASSEKSGGYNINGVASPGAVLGTDALNIDPEKANNLELGIKSSWLDQRLIANANLFLTKVTDYQASTGASINGTYTGLLTNVGDLTSKGMEFDLRALVNQHLSLGLNGAYTDATFDRGTAPTPAEEFDGSGGTANSGYGKGTRSIAGNRVNGASRWAFSSNANVRWNVADNLEHYGTVQYSWRSENYGDVNNSEYSKIAGYGLLNLSTGLRMTSGKHRWDFSLWARNVLDKRYFLGVTNAGSNLYVGSAGQPRTIGASLRYDF